ncbi:MAG: glycerol-3-phosphate responsive antiterminator [Eubacteriales bacterium]|nr:glycerol-3-phosphate responsive antiterminator [Eubacteriales bacterium]
MNSVFYDLIEGNPVIAAIKDEKGLETCCECQNIRVVFILYGTICNIAQVVERVKKAGKVAIVHMDLIEGLNGKETVVDFIRSHTEADGIISTKPALIKRAKEHGLYTILRVFILDSMSFKNVSKQISAAEPDMLEMLPGLMPKIIRRVNHLSAVPVIAGGLISNKEDVMAALSAGAISVSATNPAVWEM